MTEKNEEIVIFDMVYSLTIKKTFENQMIIHFIWLWYVI